jgi:type I restriction enzyme S subunit
MSFWPNGEAVNLTPIKQLCRLNVDVLPEDTDPDLEFDYVDIGSVTLEDGIKQKERIRFETAPSRARKLVRTGDIIVSTVRTYLKAVARIDKADDGAVVSTGFAVLRPKASVDSSFLYRLCQSSPFVAEVQARGCSGRDGDARRATPVTAFVEASTDSKPVEAFDEDGCADGEVVWS